MKMSDLKTKVYKPHNVKDSKIHLINPKLFKPTFRLILVGKTLSGKTNFVKNVLFNKDYGYGDYFDEIYFFTDTYDEIEEMAYLALKNKKEEKIQMINGFNETAVKRLYNDIKKDFRKLEEGEEPKRILFIFDDLITSGISKPSKPTILDRLFQNGRHVNISVVVMTQSYKAINRNMRSLNLSQMIVFYGLPEKELEMIAEEHATIMLGKKELLQTMKEELNEPYTFILIDHNRPIKDRFMNKDFEAINLEKMMIE